MRQYLNWKTYLATIALLIVGASLYYTSQLAQKLAVEEKAKVVQVANAIKTLSTSNNPQDLCLCQQYYYPKYFYPAHYD